MAIYIKDAKRLKNETFEDFFKRVFLDKYNSVSTYKDKECTQIQCYHTTYRSFEDILEIAKTYYHNISDKSLAKIISKYKSRSFLFCPAVQRWVMCLSGGDGEFLYNYRDCKTFTNKVGNGQYSFDMIKELMNK